MSQGHGLRQVNDKKLFIQTLTTWAPMTLKSQSLGCPPWALQGAGTQAGDDGAFVPFN